MTAVRYPTHEVALNIELRTIVVTLDPFGPPIVKLSGIPKTRNRRVNNNTEVVITTAALGPKGLSFIQEMREQLLLASQEVTSAQGVK
jgi:hypothetical protein